MKSILILTVLLVGWAHAAPERCPASRKAEADACAKKSFFMMDKSFVVLTKETMPNHCKQIDDAIKCISKYGKECLRGFTAQTLNVGLHGMKKHFRSICGEKATVTDEFIQKTQWLTKDNLDEVYMCATASIRSVQHIADKVRADEQIPQACCSYWLSRRCMTRKMKKLTTEDNQKFLDKMSDDAMQGMMDFLCSKQKSVQVCKELLPEPMTRMEDVFKNVKKGENAEQESYLIPFLDVVSEDKQ